jgi:ABC-2 type transport system permease protein
MNNVLRFAKLDYRTVKPYLTIKNMSIFIVVVLIMILSTGESTAVLTMLMVYGNIFVSYPFAVGEKNGIDALYSVLSVNRKTVVTGRYLFTILVDISTAILAFSISLVISMTMGKMYSIRETAAILITIFLIFTFIQTIQLPLFFKLGYDKAKLLAYLPLVSFPVVIILFSKFLSGDGMRMPVIIEWAISHPGVMAILIATLWCLAALTSFSLSLKYYRNRDF